MNTHLLLFLSTLSLLDLTHGACGDQVCDKKESTTCPSDCFSMVVYTVKMDNPIKYDAVIEVYDLNPLKQTEYGPVNVSRGPKDYVGCIDGQCSYNCDIKNPPKFFAIRSYYYLPFFWEIPDDEIQNASYRVCVHLVQPFQPINKDYQIVASWIPNDSDGDIGPSFLNLHVFEKTGLADSSFNPLVSEGFEMGRAVFTDLSSDPYDFQTDGPSIIDFFPKPNSPFYVWLSRNPFMQGNRTMKEASPYVVLYGRTLWNPEGKQLAVFRLPSSQDNIIDLWKVFALQSPRPGRVMPSIQTFGLTQKAQQINGRLNWDCQDFSYCSNFTAYWFCGDGDCAILETAVPASPYRCRDCGRVRGVARLAVGAKQPVFGATVSIWTDPVNPGALDQQGEKVPPPLATTLTDGSGSFSFDTLSFSASPSSVSGQVTKRFYFSVTGVLIDTSSGAEVIVQLLPLWWNWELKNIQYISGPVSHTNNSPNFRLYMTLPYTTADALIRVIYSWGNLISQDSSSIPDIDLLVAGPIDNSSENGVVSSEGDRPSTLPRAQKITSSADGPGVEVIDLQQIPGTLGYGWSSTYSTTGSANRYEFWVDFPWSLANQDSAAESLGDLYSILIIYLNDPRSSYGPRQLLGKALTGVDFVYGFQNGDQWNQIPKDATAWHVFDIVKGVGPVWTGFPGENSSETTNVAGGKYAYTPVWQPEKSLPCGHVSERGANPAYCPATLKYDWTQTRKMRHGRRINGFVSQNNQRLKT